MLKPVRGYAVWGYVVWAVGLCWDGAPAIPELYCDAEGMRRDAPPREADVGVRVDDAWLVPHFLLELLLSHEQSESLHVVRRVGVLVQQPDPSIFVLMQILRNPSSGQLPIVAAPKEGVVLKLVVQFVPPHGEGRRASQSGEDRVLI